MKLVVVGATGLVGRACLSRLQQDYQVDAVASDASHGTQLMIDQRQYQVQGISRYDFAKANVVFLCVRAQVARDLYERLKLSAITIIDNSSAFRGIESVPLVVPEITPLEEYRSHQLISSPNCIAVPVSLVLRLFENITDIVITTFQSLSGAGQLAIDQKYRYTNQIIPYIGDIDVTGQCSEEQKVIAEVRKLVGYSVSVLCTRVPIDHVHHMHISFRHPKLRQNQLMKILEQVPYISLDASKVQSSMKVTVSRAMINDGRVSLWVSSDNLHRGAAGNMVALMKQILK
jgi:aspartate-semialdehyde dehydrogenase